MKAIIEEIKEFILNIFKKPLKKPTNIDWNGEYGFNGEKGINNKHL